MESKGTFLPGVICGLRVLPHAGGYCGRYRDVIDYIIRIFRGQKDWLLNSRGVQKEEVKRERVSYLCTSVRCDDCSKG